MNRIRLYITECYEVEGDEALCFDPYPIAHPVETEQAPDPLSVKRRVAGEEGSYVTYHMEWQDAA